MFGVEQGLVDLCVRQSSWVRLIIRGVGAYAVAQAEKQAGEVILHVRRIESDGF